jgi:8-oxo-dGTP pyrophosphatase MutT (NUDIX family)
MKKPVMKAGGIVVRRDDGEPSVLLVATRKGKGWVLPKGNVKRGESPSAAALRESREEGCITGRLAGRAGVAAYTSDGRRNRVEYFFIKYTRDCKDGGEDRDRLWCSVRQATRLVSYAHARRILSEARERIVEIAAGKTTGR